MQAMIDALEPRKLLAVFDPTFGSDRRAVFPGTSNAHAVTVQADGKLLAAVEVSPVYPYGTFALARTTANGRIDKSFGVAGVAPPPVRFTTDSFKIQAVADDAGKPLILVEKRGEVHLLRYTASGRVDKSFG